MDNLITRDVTILIGCKSLPFPDSDGEIRVPPNRIILLQTFFFFSLSFPPSPLADAGKGTPTFHLSISLLDLFPLIHFLFFITPEFIAFLPSTMKYVLVSGGMVPKHIKHQG